MRITAVAALALGLFLGQGWIRSAMAAQEGGNPPPAPPAPSTADDEAAKAAAEAQAARERLAKAVEEVRVAEEKALRAERRALEKDLADREDEVDRFRAAGDREGAARAEAEVAVLAARLSAVAGRLAGGVRAAAAPPAALPFSGRIRPGATEGLPPLRTHPRDREGAVASPLDWLARHQGPGGYWDSDGFSTMCPEGKCPGAGGPHFDPGVSGLATLAFLGYGETHKTPKYGHVVTGALKYLKGIQDAEGCIGARTSSHFPYNHALGTLAMTEAYVLTQSPMFKDPAQRGVDFVLQCRNPYLAWRYGVKPGDNDTAVTGWMVMALKSARFAGLTVDEEAFKGALAWLDKVTDPETGRAGYAARGTGPARPQELIDAFPSEKSEAMTAEAILARIFCGANLREDEMVKKGADLCLASLPAWEPESGRIDYYYWYFGTLAMFQVGGEHWRHWSAALAEALLPNQRGDADGCARGSWDPVDPWGAEGGRVYATAVNAMALEVYYRHVRVFGVK